MSLPWWKYPLHAVAHGLGAGLIPVAPGTFGTVVAIPLYWAMARMSAARYALITTLLAAVGVFICNQTARDLAMRDPGSIVWDEIVGFLVAMYRTPRDVRWVLPGFVVYRLFDVWKPYPIGAIEHAFGVGTSIMADDIVAGLYTLAVLQLARLVIRRRGERASAGGDNEL